MKFPWSKPQKTEPEVPGLTFDERLKALETRFDQLVIDWDEVLAKLSRKFGREAALKRQDVLRALDAQPPADDRSEGQPEATAIGPGPSKTELWRRARAK